MNDHINNFRAAMAAAGLPSPEHIQPGKLQRFATNGKPGDDAGWYVLHIDGIPAGAFGDFRSGVERRWRTPMGRELTPDEAVAHRARMTAIAQQRAATLSAERRAALERATQLWQHAAEAPVDHAYLRMKGIKGHGLRMQQRSLIVPVMDGTDVHSLQFIDMDGSKRFLKGGRVSGCYFLIGEPSDVLCIVEGFATGASVHEATGVPVAIAFNAGNLLAAGKNLRKRFPNIRMVMCADDDVSTPGNPGRTKGAEAARAVGALLASPQVGSTQQAGVSDFNDLAQRSGLDAVKATIEKVLRPTDNSTTDQPKAGLLCAADLEPRPITWLWNGWLAVGVLHVIAGAPGTGKTTLAIALAAIISTGGRWPDGTTADQGDVVIWSGEDLIEETLLPRLRAMGADPSRVHFVHDVADAAGRRPFDPSTDLPQLLTAIREKQLAVKLVIVDPIVSAVRGDSHKNTETRRGLQPLVDFAESEGCAILGISHFTKGTAGREVVERVTGSLAFGAVARLVLVAAKMPDDQGGGRIVARAKSNLGADTGGYRYELHETQLPGREEITTSRVVWGEALEGSARELLAKAEAPVTSKAQTATDETAEWLLEALQRGAVKVTELQRSAELAGFAWRTVQRAAKQKLGVVIKRMGFGPGSPYYWSLPSCSPPDAMPAKPEQMAPMDESGTHGSAAIEPKVLPWRTEL